MMTRSRGDVSGVQTLSAQRAAACRQRSANGRSPARRPNVPGRNDSGDDGPSGADESDSEDSADGGSGGDQPKGVEGIEVKAGWEEETILDVTC